MLTVTDLEKPQNGIEGIYPHEFGINSDAVASGQCMCQLGKRGIIGDMDRLQDGLVGFGLASAHPRGVDRRDLATVPVAWQSLRS